MKLRIPGRDRVAQLCLLVAMVGLLVRATVRDRTIATAVSYYALPLDVIFALLVIASVVWISRRKWAHGVTILVAALCCLGIWYTASHFSNTQHTGSANAIRIVLWNVARLRHGLSKVLQPLLEQQPDIIALVESGDIPRLARQSPLLPRDYEVCELGGGLTVLARGTITDPQLTTFGYRNRIGTCTVHLQQEAFPIMVVDIDSNPFVSRRTAMQKVAEINARNTSAVILGDFNTPSDSVWFDELRKDYAESFEAAGSGMHVTWPSYLPLWAIDHIWVHHGLATRSSEITTKIVSDHRMVEADVERGE